mmetsp:Transcript_29607/g.32774  ORF Transcript_29607/g.32774 Transcript_29607/m.32774 type:complete len:202 (-) Transcript_29607:149-754(-)
MVATTWSRSIFERKFCSRSPSLQPYMRRCGYSCPGMCMRRNNTPRTCTKLSSVEYGDEEGTSQDSGPHESRVGEARADILGSLSEIDSEGYLNAIFASHNREIDRLHTSIFNQVPPLGTYGVFCHCWQRRHGEKRGLCHHCLPIIAICSLDRAMPPQCNCCWWKPSLLWLCRATPCRWVGIQPYPAAVNTLIIPLILVVKI